jgi:arylsulfatase A-like enzyme
VLLGVAMTGCEGQTSGSERLSAEPLLHLEDHLEQAWVDGSDVPRDTANALRWDFPEEQPAWETTGGRSVGPIPMGRPSNPPRLERIDDALRLHLGGNDSDREGPAHGVLYVDLPDLQRDEWNHVLVRVRTSDPVRRLGIAFNLSDPRREGQRWRYIGEDAVVVADGVVHTYQLRADWTGPWFGEWEDPWRQLGLLFNASTPSAVDVLSVELVSKEQLFADAPTGVRTIARGHARRRTIYSHGPGTMRFPVRVPPAGRLDVGLGVLSAAFPVSFRVAVESSDGRSTTLLEERVTDADHWDQRSVDLSSYAGKDVTLALGADSDRQGSVALWAAPTLSGNQRSDKPNVIFYVIDGAGADLMSVYGYNRKTTPFMEELAKEGVVFEYAHTNSGWTKPSTASFMTSLHHSVLGGFTANSAQIPAQATTMAQRFHDAGYQTAVFTSNPFAGSLSGLQRGVDAFRDKGAEPNSGSSAELQRDYWGWREAYPGEPYWVHFQTTDVHEPHDPVAPFAGLFVSPERRKKFHQWWSALQETDGPDKDTVLGYYVSRLELMGVDPEEFFDIQRGLYDETMAHNDRQLRHLVERLKARGEWERTLLIVASDHGHPAGSFSRFGRGLIEPQPDDWEGALADSYRTRIPLILVWPGRLPGGWRLTERVSMIDILPTVLDLAGLPAPEAMQGQSLVPLLMGEEGWQSRPVIFDQFQAHVETGALVGHVEVIDGRWAASLEIVPESLMAAYQASNESLVTAGGWRSPRPHRPSTPPLLLYDLLNDPLCLKNVNDEHPELVAKYTRLLREQWDTHKALAQRFSSDAEAAPLTAEQLQTLRALGYVE